MAVKHIFHKTDFQNGFQTENAILKITPYRPEVLILGTFNPDTPNTNFADFFYGRNYFWTAFHNLFVSNEIIFGTTRMPKRGKPQKEVKPSINEIFELCIKLKLSFGDLISEVLHNDSPDYSFVESDNISFNNSIFNLIQDGKSKSVQGLEQLQIHNQINWNVKNIIEYLEQNPQIHTVYFTRKPTGIWARSWEGIKNHESCSDRSFTNLFTPSGQGKPVYNSMQRLLAHWTDNKNCNFGRLDNSWLESNGVEIVNFKQE